MSKGNTKTSGNQGNNYPFQYDTVKLLKSGNDLLALILAALGGSPTPDTPYGPLRATGAGSVPIGAKSASIYNAGNANASINGGTNNLAPGEEVTWDGGSVGLATAISYNGTGTTLVIVYTL